jgi:hypothetical protein
MMMIPDIKIVVGRIKPFFSLNSDIIGMKVGTMLAMIAVSNTARDLI